MRKIRYVPDQMGSSRLATVEKANEIIEEYTKQGFRLTLRQLYYQFVARGLIPNKQQEYKRLGDIINDGRLQGLIDWLAIEDRTRSLSSLSTWNDPAEIVETCAKQFKIDMWGNQPTRVEIWVEKEALAGVIENVAQRYRVPFLSCRGYTSQSEMWGAAMRLVQWVKNGQDVLILHFGDHDPSGIDMSRDIQDRLRLFMQGWFDRLSFRRLALNMDQVEEYDPPPNPAKITDSRYESYVKEFGEESYELDALEPQAIHSLAEEAIREVQDVDAWDDARERETEMKKDLQLVSDRWSEVSDFVKE